MKGQNLMGEFKFTAAGLLVGFLVKLTGMGGGALLTPILTLLFGVPPTWAVGTDIVHSVFIKTASLRGYWQRKQVNFPIVLWLACGSVPATFLTAWLVGHNHGSNDLIKVIMGVMLLIAAVAFPLKGRITRYLERRHKQPSIGEATTAISWQRKTATALVGAVFGSLVALTSVGSGSLIIISLAFLYPRMDNKTLVGTDIAQALALLLAGSAGYLSTGVGVSWPTVGWLLLGSLPGVWLGSRLSGKIPTHWLNWPLTGVLAASGVALVAH